MNWRTGRLTTGQSRPVVDAWTPPVTPGLLPKRPLTLAEVLDGGFRLLRFSPAVNFGLPTIISVLLVLFGGAVAAIITWLSSDYLFGLAANSDALGGLFAIAEIFAFASSFVFLALIQFFAGVASTSGRAAFDGTRVSLSSAWFQARGRRFPLVAATLGLLLVFALLMAVFFTPGVLVTMALGPMAGVPTLLMCGLLWLAATLLILVKMSFVGPLIVFEQLSIRAAIMRSWRMTNTGFWRILLHLGLGYILSSQVVQIVLSPLIFLLYAAVFVVGLLSQFNMTTMISIMVGFGFVLIAASTVASGLMYGYWSALVVIVYFDQRMRIEGYDIEMLRVAEVELRQRTRNEGEAERTKEQWLMVPEATP